MQPTGSVISPACGRGYLTTNTNIDTATYMITILDLTNIVFSISMVAAICPMFRIDVASLPSCVSFVPCMIMVRSGCVVCFSLICSRS